MMYIKIPIHSIVDVITNSSTELFIIDKEKGVEMVQSVIDEAIKKFPAEYGNYTPTASLEHADHYQDNWFNEEEVITFLKRKGYKVEAPENPQEPQVIVISWKRGDMSHDFIKFIEEAFDTEVIDY